ncbi:MAG: UDP-N-acetylmuramoyl-L-alanine--D-glutamate ligase [Planctomycetaceae bacterium]|nr:UDP-N-acetylmuramoyl-L-alanine--D-glutamate ligase [Planctomycetaceae bacterium]
MRPLPTELAGQRVTVMGLGRFGGGQGAVEFLCSQGADVTVTDRRSSKELSDILEQFAVASNLHWHLGGHQEEDFCEADLLVVNPAVHPGNPFVELARHRGVKIRSEIGLFWEGCPGRIIGVTGTNGKSTTATLIHDCLKESGRRAWLGGNIGGSLLMSLDDIVEDDWVVLELSSFQLMSLNEMRVSPRVAVVTNFAPNHLDWHRDLDEYRHAKQTILRWQTENDIAVLNGEDEVFNWPVRGRRLVIDGASLPSGVPPALRGQHQSRNIAAAATTVRAIGVTDDAIARAVARFEALPHRLQFIGEKHGRRFYNDSAATTPESTLAALTSIEGPIVLLVGGAEKGADLGPLADGIHRFVKAAVLMGQVAPEIDRRLEVVARESPDPKPQRVIATSFEDAMSHAIKLSSPGDVILLSPGFSSHGWFTNYVDRGEQFVRLTHDATLLDRTGSD